jgi:hypothetical protein
VWPDEARTTACRPNLEPPARLKPGRSPAVVGTRPVPARTVRVAFDQTNALSRATVSSQWFDSFRATTRYATKTARV